eukprot:361631-Chlamydomonas_euryale.AAC.1
MAEVLTCCQDLCMPKPVARGHLGTLWQTKYVCEDHRLDADRGHVAPVFWRERSMGAARQPPCRYLPGSPCAMHHHATTTCACACMVSQYLPHPLPAALSFPSSTAVHAHQRTIMPPRRRSTRCSVDSFWML